MNKELLEKEFDWSKKEMVEMMLQVDQGIVRARLDGEIKSYRIYLSPGVQEAIGKHAVNALTRNIYLRMQLIQKNHCE